MDYKILLLQYSRLGMADHQIYSYFSSYLLSRDQLRQLGFPQHSSLYPGQAYIYRDPEFCHSLTDGAANMDMDDGDLCVRSHLDANAEPFVPSPAESSSRHLQAKLLYDSDSDSSGAAVTPERKPSLEEMSSISLNATAKEFVPTGGGPPPSSLSSSISCPIISNAANTTNSTFYNTPSTLSSSCNTVTSDTSRVSEPSESPDTAVERVCVRCAKTFLMRGDGEYLELDQCHYHWGKLRSKANIYTCCQAQQVCISESVKPSAKYLQSRRRPLVRPSPG